MLLKRAQVAQLHQRMVEEDVHEIEIRNGESGRLAFYVPVVTLKQFPLVKRQSKSDSEGVR